TGVTWGCPSGPTVATLARLWPRRYSSSASVNTLIPDLPARSPRGGLGTPIAWRQSTRYRRSQPDDRLPSMKTETVDPLRSPPPAFGLPEAEQVAGRVFGVAGLLTPLPSERDLNLRVDDGRGTSFLLKLQNPADDADVVEMQTEAMLHVARNEPSLPVMRIVPALSGEHWAEVPGEDGRISLARLFTFLEGHNPAAEELDPQALHAWGVTVARLGRALRGFFHPAAGYPILWDVRRASALRPMVPNIRDERRRTLV